MRGVRSPFTPLRVYVLAFALFIMVGGLALSLPFSAARGEIRFLDALFTITSAACVTGLVVLDTGKDFSLIGQLIILIWIQVGGLGIMTMSTVMLLLAGRRPSLGARMVLQDTFTQGGERDLPSLVLDVLRFTLVIELAGAVLLFIGFVRGHRVLEALYLSLFHAVSAFCNAGFSLFSDNLEGFARDWLVSLTVCALIISGGLGFIVLREVRSRLASLGRGPLKVSLHSKVVLATTGALLAAGTLLILLMEWDNTLSVLSVPERLLAAFFQSVTPRTAGFNTLPVGALANQTLLVIILLMFIGASSGSTGGGIKTGTFATLVVLGWSRLRGHEQPQMFRRAISAGSVARAMSVVLACSLLVIVATLALQVTELGTASHIPASRGRFLELLFEVVSAFGTVGLSMGITPALTDAGKLIVIAVMFLGRLGPLTVAVAVSRRRLLPYRYAEEAIMVG